jgi:hypothetical protein
MPLDIKFRSYGQGATPPAEGITVSILLLDIAVDGLPVLLPGIPLRGETPGKPLAEPVIVPVAPPQGLVLPFMLFGLGFVKFALLAPVMGLPTPDVVELIVGVVPPMPVVVLLAPKVGAEVIGAIPVEPVEPEPLMAEETAEGEAPPPTPPLAPALPPAPPPEPPPAA